MLVRIACVVSLVLVAATCSAGQLASQTDLARIFRTEKFRLIYHLRQISEQDWNAVGVHPGGRSIAEAIVDPGYSWNDQDFGDDDTPHCQLFLAAKSPRYELLSYREATQGGPMLRVLILERDGRKPKLIFYAVMHNDIPRERWTWGELKGHILQGRFDAIKP
jgi:hypothetical protein